MNYEAIVRTKGRISVLFYYVETLVLNSTES